MTELKRAPEQNEWPWWGLFHALVTISLSFTEKLPSSYASEMGMVPPVLALGVRGPKARSALQNIMGPSDPQLAGMTDCSSINAIYCRSQAEPLVYLPQLDSHVHRELCLWFGGRAARAALHGGVLDPASRCNRVRWWHWPACFWATVVLVGKARHGWQTSTRLVCFVLSISLLLKVWMNQSNGWEQSVHFQCSHMLLQSVKAFSLSQDRLFWLC